MNCGRKLIKRVLFEDNHLIVINKPGGIKVQPDNTQSNDLYNEVKEYIKITKNKPNNVYLGIIHRLDRLTSGVILFAKTSKASSRLFQSFSNRNVLKKYIALVNGKIDQPGKCEDYIDDTMNPVKIISSKEYLINNCNLAQFKVAKLSYEPLLQFTFNHNSCTVLEVQLETGRKHQIRCQLNKLGHSILGDNKYCQTPIINSFGFIGLHSYEMTFPHPTKPQQNQMSICAPVPVEWSGNFMSDATYQNLVEILTSKRQILAQQQQKRQDSCEREEDN